MTDLVLNSLNQALLTALEKIPGVYLLGEDILDPYGGAFKVTRGLSSRFPDKVITTPISEAGFVGVATGMALCGLRPVVEIMFGDFITLVMDQIINHAAKFRWMYNEQVTVPLVIRTPMGGRRGYGPTHSQTLEKLILGVPGIKVVAPSALGSPGDLLLAAIQDEDPVIFIENKLLYTCPIREDGFGLMADFSIETDRGIYPSTVLRPLHSPAQVTVATYGYNLELALVAAHELLMEDEIFCEIVVYSQLSPYDLAPLYPSVQRTNHLLLIEEGTLTLGWGAEIAAQLLEHGYNPKVCRIGARDLPIANSKSLEATILPSVQDIIRSCRMILGKKAP